LSKSGAIVMDNGDWAKFQTLMESIVKPLQDKINEVKNDLLATRTELRKEITDGREEYTKAISELPCGDNTVKLTQIETRQKDGRENTKDTKEFTLKALIVVISGMTLIVTVAGIMWKMGIFKAMVQ